VKLFTNLQIFIYSYSHIKITARFIAISKIDDFYTELLGTHRSMYLAAWLRPKPLAIIGKERMT